MVRLRVERSVIAEERLKDGFWSRLEFACRRLLEWERGRRLYMVSVSMAFALLAMVVTAAGGSTAFAEGADAAAPGPLTTPADSWLVDLTAGGAAGTNVRHDGSRLRLADTSAGTRSLPGLGYGSYVAPAIDTGRPMTAVRVITVANVPAGTRADVQVRGRSVGQQWSEWRQPIRGGEVDLGVPVSVVQVRIDLVGPAQPDKAGPSVSRVTVAADAAPPAAATVAPAAAVSSRVYATREGLQGQRTANGHVIGYHDHFVALPSRRALASNDGHEYQVQVCNPANGQCATAPVWDVGPWNTTDDYWNPPSKRQSWTDLPQGKPEAQAAYQDGYNGGHDEFGRTVANPAGIDLADGTFLDDLGMTDNGWVNVTYLWTGQAGGNVLTFAGVGGRDGSGLPYMLARRNSDGHLLKYTYGRYNVPDDLDGGYAGLTFAGVGDFNADGQPDILARRDGDGHLLLFTYGRYNVPDDFGGGYFGLTFVGVGGSDPAGRPYMLARRDGDGHLLKYTYGRFNVPDDLGGGYFGVTFGDLVDVTGGNGGPDFYARRDSDGHLFKYTYGRYNVPDDLGGGYAGLTFAGAGDFNGDGQPDILARHDGDGHLFKYLYGRFNAPDDLGGGY